MKTKQELDALKGKLSVPEQEQIASLARLVTEFSEKKVITFEGYNTLKNISSELNTIKENCVLVCSSCHSKSNFNRQHWTKFFQSLLSERYKYLYQDGLSIIKLVEIK